MLLPELRCKHLKRWTVASMVITDILHRARPWTHLIINNRHLPTTLNLDWRSRLSGICSILLAACLLGALFTPLALWMAVPCGLAVVALNSGFYRLCLRKRGLGFAFSAAALHWLYFVYSTLTFGVTAAQTIASERFPSLAARPQPQATTPTASQPSRLSTVRS